MDTAEKDVQKWTPTALETLMATTAVLSDALPRSVNAVFIHGSPIRDDHRDEVILKYVAGFSNMPRGEMLDVPYDRYADYVILNGLTREACRAKNLAYNGF